MRRCDWAATLRSSGIPRLVLPCFDPNCMMTESIYAMSSCSSTTSSAGLQENTEKHSSATGLLGSSPANNRSSAIVEVPAAIRFSARDNFGAAVAATLGATTCARAAEFGTLGAGANLKPASCSIASRHPRGLSFGDAVLIQASASPAEI